MIIKANEREINVSSVISTKLYKEGKGYPALKFIFDGAISAEDIDALSSGNIEIGDDSHEGFTTLGEISLSIGKITTAEQKLAEVQAIVDMVNEAGGIRNSRSQSDKFGYDFLNFYVNDVLVRSSYEAQENPCGTAENPIPWADETPLIPNAYYIYEDVRKVWTGETTIGAQWDDERFEIF